MPDGLGGEQVAGKAVIGLGQVEAQPAPLRHVRGVVLHAQPYGCSGKIAGAVGQLPFQGQHLHKQRQIIHGGKNTRIAAYPAQKAGNMGSEEKKEMLFWTKAEYDKFIDAVMDKPISYYAFEMLYWCGIRMGELLALTPADFDFDRGTVSITKSYQRINKQDVITTPKTKKSIRVIQMPSFLCDEMQDYLRRLPGAEDGSRIFPISKHYLHSEMQRGSKAAGVKRIRIHDLRHSHISLLIDQGFSALAIADRVGHESIDITYRYAHLFPTRQTEMADKLDSLKCEKGA